MSVAAVLASVVVLQVSTATPAANDSSRVCFLDAATRAPLIGVVLTADDTSSRKRTTAAECLMLKAGTWRARRIGYRALRFVAGANERATTVALSSLALSSLALDTVRVSAASRDVGAIGRVSSTIRIDDARGTGAATTGQLLTRLPFTQQRSARGETGLSLRGARREQVVITLDGMPLNDPSTGIADIGDLPLAALGSATVSLGADPLAAGPGASGGVLSLTTAAQRVLSARVGSWGQGSIEGAWSMPVASTLVSLSAVRRVAANDFSFDNRASSTGVSLREQRVNNDESRTGVSLGLIGTAWQVSALASHTDRGMVGAANVRTYDADRSRTDRILVRAQSAVRAIQVSTGLRSFALTYRDPTRAPLNSEARVYAGDVEARSGFTIPVLFHPSISWRVGGGRDDINASGGISQQRTRAFGSLQSVWRANTSRLEIGARVDGVGGSGTTTVTAPSLSFAVEHSVTASLTMAARAAQALRTPTLYDLYFSSPQRLFVARLNAERVLLDAELSARMSRTLAHAPAQFELALVTRDTRDAIVWFPGNFGWSPANVGMERLRGAEARARIAPKWGEFSAWGTWYDAELTTGTLRIPTPYVPKLAAGAQWIAHFKRQTASVQSRLMGRRPFSAGPRDPAYELPAVTLVDAAWTHPLPRWRKTDTSQRAQSNGPRRTPIDASITWSLENATNTSWQSVRGFPSPGRTWALAFTLRQTPPR